MILSGVWEFKQTRAMQNSMDQHQNAFEKVLDYVVFIHLLHFLCVYLHLRLFWNDVLQNFYMLRCDLALIFHSQCFLYMECHVFLDHYILCELSQWIFQFEVVLSKPTVKYITSELKYKNILSYDCPLNIRSSAIKTETHIFCEFTYRRQKLNFH
jgi:hypothetical protein